jgi:hypothetical protein
MARVSPSRILAALLVLAVAGTAVAFTLARQPDYRATIAVVAVERGPLRPAIGPDYLRGRLAAGRAELETRLERGGIDPRLLDGVAIERAPRPRGAVAISVAAATPARARQLLRLVLLQIDARSGRELGRLARRRLRTADAAVAATLAGTPERLAAERRARGLRRYLAQPRSRFGALAVRVERPERWADRLARAAPGPFPARPAPIWAAVAGGLVGGGLAAAVALLRRRRWAA